MKKLFTFVAIAVFAFGTMMADWQPSDMDATRLDKEGTNGQVQMKTIRTDDGKIILSWLRPERVDGVFSYQLHLQIFDAAGDAMFGDEGIIVCDKATRTWTTDYALTLASNGDILLGYTDVRNDPAEENAETFLYRYTQQGEPVWGVDGIRFPYEKVHENALSVEDIAPAICVSGDNIFVAVNHTEYFMEEANENNWSPSPWFPNQQMPDSVLVNASEWVVVLLNGDGTLASEQPMKFDSKMLVMQPAPDGKIYCVYDNKELTLDAQMLDNTFTNVWPEAVNIEQRPLSSGMYMPSPLAMTDDDGGLYLSYRVLNSWNGYQVLNHLNANGEFMDEAVSCNAQIDGDAGTAEMAIKENLACVAWEFSYGPYYMDVNVMDAAGEYVWPGENIFGVALDETDSWGFTPVKVIPQNDGWVILYGRSTSWNGADFMVVKIDDMGAVVWTKQICEPGFKSSGFSVVYDEKYAYIFYTQEEEYDDNWNIIPGSGGMFVMCVQIADKTTAITEVETNDNIVKTEIFTIDGKRVNQMDNGVYIVRTTDSNGNVKTTKVRR
jgi:hypothetical protein